MSTFQPVTDPAAVEPVTESDLVHYFHDGAKPRDRWRVGAEFVAAYTDVMAGSGLLPATDDGRRALLAALPVEEALQELDAELTTDPPRAAVPLAGLRALLGA